MGGGGGQLTCLQHPAGETGLRLHVTHEHFSHVAAQELTIGEFEQCQRAAEGMKNGPSYLGAARWLMVEGIGYLAGEICMEKAE